DSDLVQEYMDIWERGLIWAKTFFVSTANPTGEELQKRITHKMLREFDVPFCQEVCEAWSGDFYKELFDSPGGETEAPQEDLEEGVAPSTSYRITDEKLIELCEVHTEHYENQGNAASPTECGRYQAIWRLGRDWLKGLHVEGESRVLTHAS